MQFNSDEFLVLFAGFTLAYLLVRRWLAARNLLVLATSYIFYCWWDYRFGALLFFTSVADFTFALLVDRCEHARWRKFWVGLSVCLNLGVLGFFKYYNFFEQSLRDLLESFGLLVSARTLDIVLPVGISFYTFQSMGYVIDVYRRRLPAARDAVQFLAFVAFFPQLVAGPIERAAHLLPQFARTLSITASHIEQGLALVIYGLFQKVVLADNLAPMVELVFDHAQLSFPIVALGAVAFALQIYCDFAGYSNIARGLAKLLGFELMMNFNAPYLALSLREFWQRWHISLSTWIRDYLYVPLGGNRRGEARTCLNLFAAMLLAGLWHGAALNFLLWGAWHGCGLAISHLWRTRFPQITLPRVLAWFLTLGFVLAGWVLFRARSFDRILEFVRALGDFNLPAWWATYAFSLLVLALPLIVTHAWRARFAGDPVVEAFARVPRWAWAVFQGGMLLCVATWWRREAAAFIYFQF